MNSCVGKCTWRASAKTSPLDAYLPTTLRSNSASAPTNIYAGLGQIAGEGYSFPSYVDGLLVEYDYSQISFYWGMRIGFVDYTRLDNHLVC